MFACQTSQDRLAFLRLAYTSLHFQQVIYRHPSDPGKLYPDGSTAHLSRTFKYFCYFSPILEMTD